MWEYYEIFSTFFIADFLHRKCRCHGLGWGIENKSHEKFNILFTGNDDIDIVISCDEKSWLSLEEKLRKFFQKIGDEFCYSRLGRSYPKSKKSEESFPENRKLVCKGTPTSISLTELAEIIKTKKVVFYTGAGISAEAVPTMNKLMTDLKFSQKLKDGRNLQNYIAKIIKNPDPYVEILRRFYERCENAEPSVAHQELAKMALRYEHILITENLDQLHQKTKLSPLVFAGKDRYSSTMKNDIWNINFVITIGLNTDESGFLKWYKTNNPHGKNISINLVDTCYLSREDYSLKGDAQIIMKQLGEMIWGD
jgi:NAD-dependent SIR2 family protein deacetylase